MTTMTTDYPFTVRPLTGDEGGGYLVEFPDLPGCMSDGETVEEAVENGLEALHDWIAAMIDAGRPIPSPSRDAASAYSGRWNQRVPKSLHRRLVLQAAQEGVSMNMLVTSILAEAVGQPPGGKRRA